MLTIGVDAREICDHPAGKGQYLLRILASWRQYSDCQLVLYTHPGQIVPEEVKGGSVRHAEVKGRAILWHRAVSKRLQKDGVQVFFAALSYQSCLWNRIPTVTVVHDLAVFRLPGLVHNRRAWLIERLTLRRAVRASARLISVSESTRQDLIALMGAQPEKIVTVGEAPLLESNRVDKPLSREQREPYFLFTGTLEPRKNISAILQAFALLPKEMRTAYRLKVVGKPGWGGEDYPKLARELDIAEQVDFLGYVPASELYLLYRKATLFIFPSWYEGFGLPVVEAMALGTPVITSSTSSLPELVGPEGVTCDPADIKALSGSILHLINDNDAWNIQSRMLFERSGQYNWKDCSATLYQVLSLTAHA